MPKETRAEVALSKHMKDLRKNPVHHGKPSEKEEEFFQRKDTELRARLKEKAARDAGRST